MTDASAKSEPRTILVVENNPGDERLVRESLLPFGPCSLEHAGSLGVALERLGQGGIDAKQGTAAKV